MFQTAAGGGAMNTLPRLVRYAASRTTPQESNVALSKLLVKLFVGSFAPPRELILGFDATDDPIHGMLEGRVFHGYYDHYCVLPLYVLCGDQLLTSYLRPANINAAKHAGAILKPLFKRLRREWSDVRIVFRGDSGFCRCHMSWCERNYVGHIVCLAKKQSADRTCCGTVSRHQ